MYDLVVITALGWEARAVWSGLAGVEQAGRSGAWHGYLGDGAACLVLRAGMGPTRAAAAIAGAPPARSYVSAGCAGGLVDWLRAGDVVVASRVGTIDPSGEGGGWLSAEGAALTRWAAARGLRVHEGAFVSSAGVVASVASKAAAAATGALAVDMESGPIAATAAGRGVPFVGVRVILDGARQTVPLAATAIDPSGEIRALRAVGGAVLRPHVWPQLARLAWQRAVAERRLRSLFAVVLGGGLDAFGLGPAPAQAAAS